MKTLIKSTIILQSEKKEVSININGNNLDESRILKEIQSFMIFHDERDEICLVDIFFCITMTGSITKQESKKWQVFINDIYEVVIEINQIHQNYLDLEQKQLEQNLDEELNLCHDEKPSVLGDGLFDDDEDEDINVFIEEDAIQNKIDNANADEIEEEKESSPYVSSGKNEGNTFEGYSKEEAPLLDDCSDELTLDDEDDLPQPTALVKLEQTCKAIALVSLSTILLSGAVVMAVHAIHQVKTLF